MDKKHTAGAKVTIRGQIRIPKKISDLLGGLDDGDYVLFYEEGNRVYIRKGRLEAAEE